MPPSVRESEDPQEGAGAIKAGVQRLAERLSDLLVQESDFTQKILETQREGLSQWLAHIRKVVDTGEYQQPPAYVSGYEMIYPPLEGAPLPPGADPKDFHVVDVPYPKDAEVNLPHPDDY